MKLLSKFDTGSTKTSLTILKKTLEIWLKSCWSENSPTCRFSWLSTNLILDSIVIKLMLTSKSAGKSIIDWFVNFWRENSNFYRHYGKNIVVHILPKRIRRHLQSQRCPASWLIGSPYWLTADYLYRTIKQKLPSPNAVTVLTAGRSYSGYETQKRWCRLNVKNSRQDVTYHVIYSHAGWRKNSTLDTYIYN